nr:DUF6090 family protein [Lysobacter sp. CAU 1642]
MREQNWASVSVEFVLLVLGVFLGIQVANWNEDLADDQRSTEFTARLKADLRVEAWKYQYLLEYYTDVLAHAERAADALDGTALLSDEDLVISAYRATQYLGVPAQRATYDELISTGTFALIRDPELREAATGAYTAVIFDTLRDEGVASRYRGVFRTLLPYRVQRQLAKDCGDRLIEVGDYAGVKDSLDYPCKVDLPIESIASAAAALRSEPSLLPLLRLRIADMDTRLSDLTLFNLGALDGLRRLAQEGAQ